MEDIRRFYSQKYKIEGSKKKKKLVEGYESL